MDTLIILLVLFGVSLSDTDFSVMNVLSKHDTKFSALKTCKEYPSSNFGRSRLVERELSKVDICLQSEQFLLTKGVVKANIFIESTSQGDVLSLTVYKRNIHNSHTDGYTKNFSIIDSTLKDGWQTILMDITGEYRYGYVSFCNKLIIAQL